MPENNKKNGEIGLISIILPTHNGSKYLAQSVDSCLNQTYRNIELIIVNDASDDSTKQIVSSFTDPRIVSLENAKNIGLANSLNRGFSVSRGDYLTWTSDDNYYSEDALAKLAFKISTNKTIDFVYAGYFRIAEDGELVDKIKVSKSLNLLRRNCIGPCFLYTRKVYRKIGSYNPDYFLAEDYEYWIRVLKSFKMVNMEDYLYYYRLHRNSLTDRHKSESAASVARKAFEDHVTIRLRIRYHLMIYKEYFLNLFK